MIHEIAEIDVQSGSEAEFEAAVAKAVEIFRSAKGCLSLTLERGIENSTRYRLVVGWNSVADHTEGFRNSEGFQAWRGLVGRFFATPPRVEHVQRVLDGF